MTSQRTHPGMTGELETLGARLRTLGLLMLGVSSDGELTSRPPRGQDWLGDLFCRSPIFTSGLRSSVGQWIEQDVPAMLEVSPGLWLVPIPLTNRRRRLGYAVILIVTAEFLDSAYLPAMCHAARLDLELCRRLLAQLPPAVSSEVPRLAAMVRDAFDTQMRLTADTKAVEKVGQQLADSYEEISLLYSVIRSMTVVERPDRFLSIVCDGLLETLPYAWIGAQMSTAEAGEQLKALAGQLHVVGALPRPEEEIRALAHELLAEARPDQPRVLDPASNPRHAAYAAFGQPLLVHPVSTDDHVIGVLLAGTKEGEDRAASSVDLQLLGATAAHLAIFVENAALYEDLNAMFLGTLEALTASIDAKDRYTCGHSQRVAMLTQRLGHAVGLDERTVSRMHIAGLVHDVGKIGVPERVLLKPGRLTEKEFQWIRRHPEMGYRILKDIPQLEDVLPGVLHHHERWDGRGYPAGLAGSNIPMVARVIALADSFDAMSSTRTYRASRSRREVLQEIIDCANLQFDPALAPVFVKLDFQEYDRLVSEHCANEHPHHEGQDEAA